MENNIEKRMKEKQIRWKQPYANAKMEDLFEILQSVYFENEYFRQLLIEKGILEKDEFANFINKNLIKHKQTEQTIKNSEIEPDEVTI